MNNILYADEMESLLKQCDFPNKEELNDWQISWRFLKNDIAQLMGKRGEKFLSYISKICSDKNFQQIEKKFYLQTKKKIKILKYSMKATSHFHVPVKEMELVEKFSKKYSKQRNEIIKDKDWQSYIDQGTIASRHNQKSCHDIDLRGNNKVARQIYNQKSLNWCFAFTSADLLNFHLKEKISLIDLVNMSSYESDITENNGGIIQDTLERAIMNGVCLEKDLPYRRYIKDGSDEDHLMSILPNLRDLHIFYQQIKKDLSGKSEKEKNDFICEQRSKYQLTDTNKTFQEIFKHLNDPLKVITIYTKEKKKNILAKLIEENCKKKRIDLSHLQMKTANANEKDSMTNIDKVLEQGNIVGIGYNSNYLLFPYNFNVNLNASPHASSIVGRRFNNNTGGCEYLIKNSSGKDCHYYSPSLDCEKGFIWLPEELLAAAAMDFTWVEPKKKK